MPWLSSRDLAVAFGLEWCVCAPLRAPWPAPQPAARPCQGLCRCADTGWRIAGSSLCWLLVLNFCLMHL